MRRERNFGLDVLRLAAIVPVLALHAYFGFYVGTGLSPFWGVPAALSACAAMFSLDWFFVLSGFLIGSMMIRSFERQGAWWPSARDFWLRRWFRTVPNYYLFLLLNLVLVWLGLQEGRFDWRFLVFSQNLAWPQDKPYFFSEAWSLALEEWFYLLMPLLLGLASLLLPLKLRHRFWLVAGILVVLPTVLRVGVQPTVDFFDWDHRIRRVSILHLDSAGWGVAAAIVSRWHPRWWHWRQGWLAVFGLGLMALAVWAMFHFVLEDWRGLLGGGWNDLLRISAVGAGTACVLPWLSDRCRAPVPVRKLAARLADYVYSMYLCHYPLIFVLLAWLQAGGGTLESVPGWLVPLWLLLVLCVAALVFHGFERPVTRLRERMTRQIPAGPFATTA